MNSSEEEGKRRAAKPQAPKSAQIGWLSTDELEIERRRLRAGTEPLHIKDIQTEGGYYGDYTVTSRNEEVYFVQVRALSATENSCNCMDYRKNGLGTCKHIEAVLLNLQKRGKRAYQEAAEQGSPYAEIYLSRKGAPVVCLLWPAKVTTRAHAFLSPFFQANGALLADPVDAVPALKRALDTAPSGIQDIVRLSQDVEDWVAELTQRRNRTIARESFLKDVADGKRTLDILKMELFPYQRDGMLHLAFNERALLADEMGLGKTAQAIAACELLRQTRRIERVLVVSPASLKAEWEEQIGKFTSLPSRIVWGPRAARLKLYQTPSFFYLCNYEQVVSDWKDINETVAPDVVILDEAQRIKNWQTKTAQTIKRLASPYAFVLTGTPLENRIDEVYSIIEFLDPAVFGSLFRFNREFYELDEKGRPIGYRNLPELHRRLQPVMLRRRKGEVEEQLPGRTVTNYFVAMESEQRARYAEYSDRVARILKITKKRPLMKEEFERLQRYLACMRMICDTPFILDPDCRICPKLPELADILADVLASGDSKVIIFSEWERMLQLVKGLADERKLTYAWHTGSVPQQKRRLDINRFKQDPSCRLFLSTDSGATGLNLQAANVVINLDLPWNPAKLEQRIARAWRKHQTRSVTVINLVCEESIEHRMLSMLEQKQSLADGVLDGRGDLSNLKMPSGRAALVERLESLMGVPAQPVTTSIAVSTARAAEPLEQFRQDLVARLDTRLLHVGVHTSEDGRRSILVCVEGPLDQVQPLANRLLHENFAGQRDIPALELLDRHTFDTIQRLAKVGILKLNQAGGQTLLTTAAAEDAAEKEKERLRRAARKWMEESRRKARMSQVLKAGGFPAEALPSLREAMESGLRALLCLGGEAPDDIREVPLERIQSSLMARDPMPASFLNDILALRKISNDAGAFDEAAAKALLTAGERIVEWSDRIAVRYALS